LSHALLPFVLPILYLFLRVSCPPAEFRLWSLDSAGPIRKLVGQDYKGRWHSGM
jgi:hypothetical protein